MPPEQGPFHIARRHILRLAERGRSRYIAAMSDTLKIASWNINSVRVRLDIVERFLREESPDILCLQEIKVLNEQFPAGLFRQLGYNHQVIHGQPMYHGVAILSRIPIHEDHRHDWQDNGEARHVGVMLENGVRLENVYIPAGGDIPDAKVNPKFAQKLAFLQRMTDWSGSLKTPTILVGDFNVAPLECDVWNHKALLDVVSHTPIEVETLAALQQSHGWVDLGRQLVPAPERLFTWWSYRARDWATSDRGRRLDHMWASPSLAGAAKAHRVHEPIRGWMRPSDHVPLVTEFVF
jgi:exodeoxyribonuclease-3